MVGTLCCPNDGSELPSIPTGTSGVHCCYCPSCKAVFAFIADPTSSRYVAAYTWNADTRRWLLSNEWETNSETLAEPVVSTLPGQWIAGSSLAMVDYVDVPEMAMAFARKKRLLCCAVVRRFWSRLTDERLRKCVEVAENFTDGLVTSHEMGSAFSEFHDAAMEGPRFNDTEGPPTVAAVYYAAFVNALPRECLVAAARIDPGQTSESAHIGLLRDIFGPLPFRPITTNPLLLTAPVLALAQAVYNDRKLPEGTLDDHKLLVLADAVEEAGGRGEILEHLRSEGPHVRGCWAVDLLLGKS